MSGIYPREPGNKKKASKSATPSTTFYYTKDIQYLLHEPLLRKFRAHKALAKKISKALGRGEVSDAARLERLHKPRLSLDHIIKERYPTFFDALRDLDDALSMISLFANLPTTTAVPAKTIALCQRLCLEFQHYLIVSRSLRKSFLSIKGIYYQATIQGQDILWLVPYQFVQRMTDDVDFRIMGTFVHFYTTLLGFVNFKLYTSIGLVYPPRFDATSNDRGAELRAFTLEGKPIGAAWLNGADGGQRSSREAEEEDTRTNGDDTTAVKTNPTMQKDLEILVREIAADEDRREDPHSHQALGDSEPTAADATIDVFDAPISADADILPQPGPSAAIVSTIFAPFTFFLSRESPRAPLEFLLRAFGCNRIGWDMVSGDGAYTTDEGDPTITHQVVDRPPMSADTVVEIDPGSDDDDDMPARSRIVQPRSRIPGRIYVQPQWVWDCVNAGQLLRPDLYAPGAELPPHLSPWVKATKGQYDPTVPLTEQEQEGEADEEMTSEEDEQEDVVEASKTVPRRVNGFDETQDPSKMKNKKLDDSVDLSDSGDEAGGDMDVAHDQSSADEADDDTDAKFQEHLLSTVDKGQNEGAEEWAGFDDDDDQQDGEEEGDDDDEATVYQRELEAEAAGLPLPVGSITSTTTTTTTTTTLRSGSTIATKSHRQEQQRKSIAKKRRAEQEELDRQKMMMSRKKRKTLEKILHSDKKRDDEALRLRRKRRRIERGQSGAENHPA